MKQIILTSVLAASLAAGLAAGLTAGLTLPAQATEGRERVAEGLRLLLEGLMGEVEPMLDDLRGRVEDLNAYDMPEVLPNGDIIIRRKIPLEVDPLEEGEIEL